MRSLTAILTCLIIIVITTSCKTAGNPRGPRARFIHLLEQEMCSASNTNWVRIHAADALNDHGRGDLVAAAYAAELGTDAPQYRIGVWRVMARAATTEEARHEYADRVRTAMLDTRGPDRLHAVETMAKLGFAQTTDRPALEQWAASVDEATAAFIRWLLVLSSDRSHRPNDEAKLTQLLDSTDVVARQRAAFALGRIKSISPASYDRLTKRFQSEPADSPARAYLLVAVYQHTPTDSPAYASVKNHLVTLINEGKPNEQLEAAQALGKRGSRDDLPTLAKLLENPEADARIGAAAGSLTILK